MKLKWLLKTRTQRNSTLKLALVFAQWIGMYQLDKVIQQILSCTETAFWNEERLYISSDDI